MSSLFLEENIELEFIENGFVVLPLLDETSSEKLLNLYHQTYRQPTKGLQALLRIGTPDQNIQLHQEIGELVKPRLNHFFKAFSFNANHFIVKSAGDPNEFKLHQDWCVVNEKQHLAAHIWIALQDTNQENGGLFLVKGSHRFFNNIRSGSCGIAFIDSNPIVKKHLTTFQLKKGEAVVYQQSLFHGSFANSSSSDRIICLTSLRPQLAPMTYYQCNDLGIQEISITPELLFKQIATLEKGFIDDNGLDKKKAPIPEINTNQITNSLFESLL